MSGLFTPQRRRAARWRRRALEWLTPAILFCILGARRPGAFTRAQLWAEDGTIWLRDSLVFGRLHALVRPYAGYWEASSRVLALVASPLPLRWIPTAYAVLATLCAALCAAVLVKKRYRRLLRSDLLRLAVCIAAVLAIPVGWELVAVLTNVQWWIQLPAVLWVAVPPRTRSHFMHGVQALLGLLMGASNPALLLLLPWVAWRAVRAKSIRLGGALWGLCVGVVFETMVVRLLAVQAPTTSYSARVLAKALVVSLSNRVMLATLAGTRRMLALRSAHAAAAGALFCAVVLLSLVVIARAPRRSASVLVPLYLGATSVGMALALRGLAPSFQSWQSFELGGDRYFFLAAACGLFVFAVYVQRLFPRLSGGLQGCLFLLIVSSGIRSNARIEELPASKWAEQVPAMEDWIARQRRGENVPTHVVEIFPWSPIQFVGRQPGDASFEEGGSSWYRRGELTVAPSTRAHLGQKSLEQRGGSGFNFQEARVENHRPYEVSAWVFLSCRGDGSVVELTVSDGEWRDLVTDRARLDKCEQWQPLRVRFEGTWTQRANIQLKCTRCREPVLWDDVNLAGS